MPSERFLVRANGSKWLFEHNGAAVVVDPYSVLMRGGADKSRISETRMSEPLKRDGDIRTAREVFDDHLRLNMRGTVDEDLARNYSPELVVLTGAGFSSATRACGSLLDLDAVLREKSQRDEKFRNGHRAWLARSSCCPRVCNDSSPTWAGTRIAFGGRKRHRSRNPAAPGPGLPHFAVGGVRHTKGQEARAMSLSQMFRSVAAGLLVLGLAGYASAQPSSEHRLSKKELKALLASASTPEDHEKLARHFEAKAAALEADATEHEELVTVYRTPPPSTKGAPPVRWDQHCKSLATSLRKSAVDARRLADDHKKMAEDMPKASS